MRHSRHYTLDEANSLLGTVGEALIQVRRARHRLAARGFDARFATVAELSGGAWPGREHARAALEMVLGFDTLERLDVVVRDLERGLIDFPSLLGGDEVYLCWQLGEASVGHWHAVESGFGGRRPIG